MEALEEVWTEFKELTSSVYELFTQSLFQLGENDVSLGKILYLFLAFFILTFLARRF